MDLANHHFDWLKKYGHMNRNNETVKAAPEGRGFLLCMQYNTYHS
jgi:hypothetical protein